MSYTDWGLFSRSLHSVINICHICISRIVTQNTLKCAISTAKFHFFLGRVIYDAVLFKKSFFIVRSLYKFFTYN